MRVRPPRAWSPIPEHSPSSQGFVVGGVSTLRYLDATGDPALVRVSAALAEWAGEWTAAAGEDLFLLRRQRPYFLLGPGDRRLSDLPRAVAWAREQGLPVYRRIGGGSLVFLDEGCLSFAAATACRDVGHLTRHFKTLTRPVFEALRSLGLDPVFGAASGSYCEGPWDILAGGRKIAGVSQAMRRGYALVSGMILVNQDPAVTTARVNAFYREAGAGEPFRATGVTSLGLLCPQLVTPSDLRRHIEAALGPFERLLPSAADRPRLEELLTGRRVSPPPETGGSAGESHVQGMKPRLDL